MVTRRLRRWGLKPRLRDGHMFICYPRRVKLNLGEFFAIFEYDDELKIARPDEPIMSVLNNRISRFSSGFEPWKRYVDNQKKEAAYKKDQASAEFEEMLTGCSTGFKLSNINCTAYC